MTYAAILCAIDGGPETESTLATGIAVARDFDAYLEVMHVSLDPQTVAPMMADGMTGATVDQLMRSVEADVEERRKKAEAAYAEKVVEAKLPRVDSNRAPGKPGFGVAWRHVHGREHTEVARRGRLFDLIVLPRRSVDDEAAVSPTLETVLMEGGRPILIASTEPERIGRHVAIGWNGSAQAAKAVAASLPFLKRAEAIHVCTVKEHNVQADPGALVRYLGRHGLRADEKILEAGDEDAGAALLEGASQVNADLVVAGGYGHSRLREFILGGATNTLLRSAGLPVLISH